MKTNNKDSPVSVTTEPRIITPDEQRRWELQLQQVITGGFDEAVNLTYEWLSSEMAKDYFIEQRGMLNTFFRESGIQDEWDRIVETRAIRGADVTSQIFDYARKINMTDHLVEYTDTERRALNRLCDYNYEMIVNVTRDEISAIRRKLVQDYAEGRHPTKTGLKELQLQPINGWTPQQRAEVIARTESARTLNVSTLETLRNDGVEMVILYGCDLTCAECMEYNMYPVPIDEAMEIEVPHPNCTGVWVTYREEYIQERLDEEGVTREDVVNGSS